ncbi:MAG: AMP-binding protein [Chloroflexi bacterium]|nr:AMP-binding protein [Chloroflexota bacterium]MCI0579676.1 AMP-binding protein [Chloroflexota bacterium]MCI0645884.1 AMP-binding protein [Chloroflexota bacterium]MCI0725739.1 AMP-binding protein [Chloroflexota bacterium]
MIRYNYQNLIQPVVERAEHDPEHLSLVLIGEDGAHTPITAGQFHDGAARWAQALQYIGIGPGDIVLLVLGHSQKLIFSFWGALYLGALPSIYPTPTTRMDQELYVGQVRSLVAQSGIKAVITPNEFKESTQALLAGTGCAVISTDEIPPEARQEGGFRPAWEKFGSDKIAFLQFSSGTTGAKKGVLISHQAIMNQGRTLNQVLDLQLGDTVISWLPLHHDMGLTTGFLIPIVTGVKTVLMSPVHWVRDPKILLWAVNDYKGTHSWMPNFAYNHLMRAVRPGDIEGVDLSSWRQVLNGAEPIRYETIQAFAARFRPYGLREEALTTGYGMAENTLGIAVKPHDRPIKVDWISLRALQEERQAVPADPQAPGVIAMVASGTPVPGTEVIVVNEAGQRLPDRQVGEIWLRGDSLFAGYYHQPELTAGSFRDSWFCTGDLGYMIDDWVFVTGRQKDLIIVGGKNIHPEDVEEVANTVPGVYPGRVVAFGVWNERQGTEGVVIVCEVRPPITEEEKIAISNELHRRLAQQMDIALADVRLVENRWIVKSSSGKLARPACRERYLQEFPEA